MPSAVRWSLPIESLLDAKPQPCCDVLVIGSGYGGSFAARALAGEGCDVCVVERGKEYALGEFAQDMAHLPAHLRLQRHGARQPIGGGQALMDFRLLEQVGVLLANGLGGGSLINAGVARKPDAALFDGPDWPVQYRVGGSHHQELLDALQSVVADLGARPLERAEELPKFKALQRLGQALGTGPVEALELTIASQRELNAHGLQMEACVRCGNCFTGCNQGAKGTLVTSIIPAGAARGARFFTGALALQIEPLEPGQTSANGRPLRWRVHMERSAVGKNQPASRFTFDAHAVIVSAGTLGSTELLLRSPHVSHSDRLGERFSTNGDFIAMGWRQKSEVNGVSAPQPDSAAPSNDVGPTITGTLELQLAVGDTVQQVLVQDGAIPSALAQAASVLGSSLSTLYRYIDQPGARFEGCSDPLAVPAHAARHMQLLLLMGRDAADGRIVLRESPAASAPGSYVDVEWPAGAGGKSTYYELLHNALRKAHKNRGFDGGDYLPNPWWRLAPDDFAEIAAGSQPARAVTVHPLGGCAMADEGLTGVVDWRGAVFTGAGCNVHEGLHVLDGAIVPCALGVNPLVTISALALVAARSIGKTLPAPTPTPASTVTTHVLPTQQPSLANGAPFAPAGPIKLHLHEHLLGQAATGTVPDWALPVLSRGNLDGSRIDQPRALIATVDVTLDVHDWMANPSKQLEATLKVFANPFPDWPTVRPEATALQPLFEGTGSLTMLKRDARAWPIKLLRLLRAVANFIFQRRSGSLAGRGNFWHKARAFLRAGWLHTEYRKLDYQFALISPDLGPGASPGKVDTAGTKLLAYRCDRPALWQSLNRLELTLRPAQGEPWLLRFEVDLADLVKRLRLQVAQAPDTPAAIIGLAAFASTWLRAIMHTHFWSWRGLDYPQFLPNLPVAPAQPGPLVPTPGAVAIKPAIERLEVIRGSGSDAMIALRITRYGACDAPRQVLLLHGLAHGSAVFTTDTIDVNMTQHFLANGYTVWLLDSRMSNALNHAQDSHTMDDIAQYDIPKAIDHVFSNNGGQAMDVFAHCVGAGTFAMAILAGHVPAERVKAAIIHAVHPWVVPSLSNRFSGALAAMYRDMLPNNEPIDPQLPALPRLADELIDRFGATLPWPDAELQAHRWHRGRPQLGCAVCNRMTAFYGREWNHANLDERTHRRLAELVGPAGMEVFRQLYFIILRERLTNRHGENAYLQQHQLQAHWVFPTLFVHGIENQVFDPRAATRSWNRMRLALGGTGPAIRLFLKKGYGHMDFLFGASAAVDIYPQLTRFLLDPSAFQDQNDGCYTDPTATPSPDHRSQHDFADRESSAPSNPLTGPMLQVETLANGRRRLVVWLEQYFDTTSPPAAPRIWADGRHLTHVQCFPFSVPASGQWVARGVSQAVAGAGFYWTCVIDETDETDEIAELLFQDLHTLMFEMTTQPPGISDLANPLAQGTGKGVRDAKLASAGRFGVGGHQGVYLGPMVLPERIHWLTSALSMADKMAPEATTTGQAEASAQPDAQAHRPELLRTDLDLHQLPWWRRWCAVATGARQVSFAVASCRWPGMAFEQDAVDRLALHIDSHVQHATQPIEALLLVGDQIYADATANLAETTERSERGAQRYRSSWGADATRRLLSRIPTWLIVDDHEFGDNVDGAGSAGVDTRRGQDFENGFHAAFAYQARFHRGADLPSLSQVGGRWQVDHGFWHPFSIGGVAAFAADTRSERGERSLSNWRSAEMMHTGQLDAIKQWLLAHQHEPKFLCCGSVFGMAARYQVANPATCIDADDWCGYPATWQALVSFIVANEIHNLVFISGDYHLSALAELTLYSTTGSVRALSLVCSAWNATLPFANSQVSEFDFNQTCAYPLGTSTCRVESRATLLSDAQRQFCKVTLLAPRVGANRWELEVRAFGSDGSGLNCQRWPL